MTLDEAIAGFRAVLERAELQRAELQRENDRLTKENRELWSTVHAYQDAAAERAREG